MALIRIITKFAKEHRVLRTVQRRASNICSTFIPEFENHPEISSYDDLYAFSLKNTDEFWGTLAKSRLSWQKPFETVSDCNLSEGQARWFDGGQLNAAVNCVERHAQENPDRIALIWEKDEPGTQVNITYKELHEQTCKMANTLESHGIKKGDRVVIYMPVSPMAIEAMMACARIGAVHSVVFAGFSAEALASRIVDANAETVITADEGVRGGKLISLKKTVDEAVKNSHCVKRVFVYKRTGNEVSKSSLDICLEEQMSKASPVHKAAILDSEDLLFILYTSGSTGKPKGIAHSIGGYLLYASFTQQTVFNYQPGDIFGCVADIGWITGHSYVVYGPLCNGATTVIFESVPTYPDPGRYWEMVERLKINQFYGSPTALRLLLRYDDSFVTKYDRSSLKTLGCVGEPLNHEAWSWFHTVVGEKRCDVVDTWWQTETGGISITPRPSAPGAHIEGGMPMRPFLGQQPCIVGNDGKIQSGNDVEGALCLATPWPGMARTIYGDSKRFVETYFRLSDGVYFSGDGAHRHSNGYYQITGRMDDVINVSGHRLGTAEIEDAMDEHKDVSETAVVGFPHELKGEGIYAFVSLKESIKETPEEIIDDLKKVVKTKIASYAVPDFILITSALPKTRSGKIMRRILRKIAANKEDELGDISTLADPESVSQLVESHKNMMRTK
ncbi:DgyrCDS673 [Dimorphilus gyrociliatus]|uniref:Acetyl-coenzyme A synthetase n=1 Tax=Dimorphilus gyrociliatus TaxID=2664684 RepID=A0A7I8V540_9ANNE|nr:DgyrCDS673 [Dimorphilus gyrociliatus]